MKGESAKIMKVKVKINFRDKDKGEKKVGEIYEVTKERYEVLSGKNPFKKAFVEKVEAENPEKDKNTETENPEENKE